MKLHHFFVDNEIGESKRVVISDSSLFHQLKNVFRFTVGAQVVLLDNSGFEYYAMVEEFRTGDVVFSIVSKRESPNAPARELVLFVSLLKKDKFEWIVEKGTELGVSKFIPVLSDRSEKKGLNIERLEKIIKESAEQSERAMMPKVSEAISFEESLKQDFPCFVFDPKGDTFTIEHAQNYSPLGIFIGPEGGWSEKELFLFKKNNFRIYSLGSQILRAETAAIVVPAIILLG
jgi:16S rRNA (uracil1498-N3)-methyltransferase